LREVKPTKTPRCLSEAGVRHSGFRIFLLAASRIARICLLAMRAKFWSLSSGRNRVNLFVDSLALKVIPKFQNEKYRRRILNYMLGESAVCRPKAFCSLQYRCPLLRQLPLLS